MKPGRQFIVIMMGPLVGTLVSLSAYYAVRFAPPLTSAESAYAVFSPPAVTVVQRKAQTVTGLACPLPLPPRRETGLRAAECAVPFQEGPPVGKEGGPKQTKVSLIMINERGRMAIIDGVVVRQGDRFHKSKVARIEKDGVLLKHTEGEKWLRIQQ